MELICSFDVFRRSGFAIIEKETVPELKRIARENI